MKGERRYSEVIGTLHILIIAACFFSPWLFKWPIIILAYIIYHLQLYLFKGCILSRWQFGKNQDGFYHHYLKKVFPRIKREYIDIVVDYLIPLIIISLAVYIQTSGQTPLFKLLNYI